MAGYFNFKPRGGLWDFPTPPGEMTPGGGIGGGIPEVQARNQAMNQTMLPDYMPGIQQSLADNAAQGAQNDARRKQKREDFGYNLGTVLLAALSGLGGDPVRSGMMIGQARAERKDAKLAAAQLAQVHAAIDADPNMSPQEKVLAKANLKAYTENWAQQFGTHNVNAGDTLERGLGGGHRSLFTAPKVHDVSPGNELVMSNPIGTSGNGVAGMMASGQDIPNDMLPSGMREVPGGNGGAQKLYTSATEIERYADLFGRRGSPEWKKAAQDYRLQGNGPTAFGFDQALLGDRLETTRRGQDQASGDRRRGQDIASRDRQRGQDITDKRIRSSALYQGRGGKGRGASSNRPRATNAQGQTVEWNGKAWVPVN